jgi:hypothetical protein
MAIPHTTSITFPEETVNSTDTVQLVLTFSTQTDSANVSVTDPRSQGMVVTDYGELSYDWDYNSGMIVYSDMRISIADTGKYIHDLLFDYNAISERTDLNFTVEFYINGNIVFKGQPADDTIEWDENKKLISFTAVPLLDALNYNLYDENGDANTELPTLLGIADYSSPIGIISIIEKIFQIADAAFSTSIVHKWNFIDTLSNEITLADVQLPELDTIFANQTTASACGMTTLKDVLRYFGDAFQMYYLIIGTTVYLKQLYCCHSPVTITGPLSHKKMFDHIVFKYVYVFSDTGAHNHSESYGSESSVDGENIEVTQYFDAYDEADTRVISNINNDARIEVVEDENEFNPNVVGQRMVHAIAASLFYFRANYYFSGTVNRGNQSEEFRLSGISSVPYTDLIYDSFYYFITTMIYNFKENETTIRCMNLNVPVW